MRKPIRPRWARLKSEIQSGHRRSASPPAEGDAGARGVGGPGADLRSGDSPGTGSRLDGGRSAESAESAESQIAVKGPYVSRIGRRRQCHRPPLRLGPPCWGRALSACGAGDGHVERAGGLRAVRQKERQSPTEALTLGVCRCGGSDEAWYSERPPVGPASVAGVIRRLCRSFPDLRLCCAALTPKRRLRSHVSRYRLERKRFPANEADQMEALAQRFTQHQAGLAEVRQDPARGPCEGVLGLKAQLTVRSDVPDYARVGIFAAPATYEAWVRFSNGGFGFASDHVPTSGGSLSSSWECQGRKSSQGWRRRERRTSS